MNEKWSEKTTLEKIATIISGIALCAWLAFEFLERQKAFPHAEMAGYIAIGVICLCEAISFWRVKRVLSYVAIAGLVLMASALVLLAL